MKETRTCRTPDETFELGEEIGRGLKAGDAVLLTGGLGAGKTLLTKGILQALGFDIDEVTSPSFALVNLYNTADLNIYHIDLWRIGEKSDASFAVGLDEILNDERAVTIIEWAERLGPHRFPSRVLSIRIDGDGDDPRLITIERTEQIGAKIV